MQFENGAAVPSIDFDYDILDDVEPPPVDPDALFWRQQAEIFEECLRFFTERKTLDGRGSRVCALTAFLCPHIIDPESIDQRLKEEVSQFLVRTQEKFPPVPGYYQKIASLRKRGAQSCKPAK